MQKQLFDYDRKLMNAAGSLGFSPDSHGPIDPKELGMFITNPISLRPRKAANGPRLIHYSGGALFHTGHPNPGLKSILKSYRSSWARADLPILVHLLAASPEENTTMTQLLEEIENVAGIELGFPNEVDAKTVKVIVNSALGELPIMARVPLSNVIELGETAF
ncbi:MAG: hypothetical protein HOH75_05555, partial [Chloroflexi bacterium]|nr:hypothetical protein [Chloroflexota bacterium]